MGETNRAGAVIALHFLIPGFFALVGYGIGLQASHGAIFGVGMLVAGWIVKCFSVLFSD